MTGGDPGHATGALVHFDQARQLGSRWQLDARPGEISELGAYRARSRRAVRNIGSQGGLDLGWLVFDQPERRNAIDVPLWHALARLYAAADRPSDPA